MGFLHIRLREGRDDDISAWYDAQEDKSQAVRDAIRATIRQDGGDDQEAVIREAVARELGRLPNMIAAAVRDALEAYDLTARSREPNTSGDVDAELAARLDGQLDDFFRGE
jgi:hypothetical protein